MHDLLPSRPKHTRSKSLVEWSMILAFLALLCAPAASLLAQWQPGGPLAENRALAPAPAPPQSFADLIALPQKLSRFADDHFGLRAPLLRWGGWLRFHLFGEFANVQVISGPSGRLFLTSHLPTHPYSHIRESCGIGVSEASTAQIAGDIARLLDAAHGTASKAAYVGIPTSAVLYPAELPGWLARRCQEATPISLSILDQVRQTRPDLAPLVTVPLAELRAMEAEGENAIPQRDFHWEGQAARRIAILVAHGILGLPDLHPLPVQLLTRPSDLAQFTPGLNWSRAGATADHAAAGLRSCYGAGCIASLAPVAAFINEMSQFSAQDGRGPRVLIVSDSFGTYFSQFIGAFTSEALHVNMALDRMNPEQLLVVRNTVLRDFRPDIIIFVAHDGGMRSAGVWADRLFGP